MKLASVNVDSLGESYFGEVESADPPGSPKERGIPVSSWQIWETLPSHFADFRPVESPQCLALMSGKLEITVSTGEKRYFSRGDTLLLQDVRGKGHTVRTIGKESASVMLLTMKGIMTETAS